MSMKYNTPSIDAILEHPEDEAMNELKPLDEGSPGETSPRAQHRSHESGMRANMGRERSRKHRSENTKQSSKSKSKNTSARRGSVSRRDVEEEAQVRHRRNVSHRDAASSSSEGEEGELVENHRSMLVREHLTSPSMISSLTAQTTATNKSSSSSGSNSTVTKASLPRRSSLGKTVEIEDAPMSPAVPDPPAMYSFIDDGPAIQQEEDSDQEEEEHEQEEEEEEEEEEDSRQQGRHAATEIQWPKPRALMEVAYEEPPPPANNPRHPSASSSATSSFHGDDNFSEQLADNDTDRSTSPERSDRGHGDSEDAPKHSPASDQVSAKIASQIAAARQRQGSYSSVQQFGTPEMPRGNMQLPHVPASVLSSRPHYQVSQRPLPRAEKLPITGYEQLAIKLASSSTTDVDTGPKIKPMYRKFEALNHRLLLHLQDELSELEEQLHRLDHADTQSRRMDRHIIPASRRAAAQAGGELEWHKTDILGRIGFKLAQYNQALSSFNGTQSLPQPAPAEIDDYRDYLYAEQPIAETETHFLDPEEDLVTISRHGKKRRHHHRTNSFESGSMVSSVISQSAVSSRGSTTHPSRATPSSPSAIAPASSKTVKIAQASPRNPLPILAAAIAVAVLIPILSFLVIPGLLGRVVITILVALSVMGGLLQTRLVERNVLLSQDGGMCAGLYGGVMLVIAGFMA